MVTRLLMVLFFLGLGGGCVAESDRPAAAHPKDGKPTGDELAKRIMSIDGGIPADQPVFQAAEKLARSMCDRGKHPECVDLLRKLLISRPERCDLHRLRAEAFAALEDDESAFDCLRSCLKARPDDTESLFTLGGMLGARYGNEPASVAEAVALWEHFLQVAPDHPRASMVRQALPRLKQRLAKQGEKDAVDK